MTNLVLDTQTAEVISHDFIGSSPTRVQLKKQQTPLCASESVGFKKTLSEKQFRFGCLSWINLNLVKLWDKEMDARLLYFRTVLGVFWFRIPFWRTCWDGHRKGIGVCSGPRVSSNAYTSSTQDVRYRAWPNVTSAWLSAKMETTVAKEGVHT